MRVAYLDCFSGISGNMVLGALLDAGLELDELRDALARLSISGYELEAERVRRRGLTGTHVEVKVEGHGPERHLHDIEAIITNSQLRDDIQQRSLAIFRRLAEAEAKVHGAPIHHVHFHEVGAVDAIVDIVGAVVGLDLLGIERLYASPVHIGRGTTTCAHGVIPVPAPATAELLRGVPVYGRDVDAELTTPTGAALLTSLVESVGAAPSMSVSHIGYGAGTRDLPHANMLRISIGESQQGGDGYAQDQVVVLETNIDDMNPEFYDHVMGRLFDAGAVDVFLTPIAMKRSRPGTLLTALTTEDRMEEVVTALFEETTTIGVRFAPMQRWILRRERALAETAYGAVAVKVARRGETVMNVAPEVEDCRRLAREQGVPLKAVYQAAQEAAGGCPAEKEGTEEANTSDVGTREAHA